MNNVCLNTQRLTIREFEVSDWRDVLHYASDLSVVGHTTWGPIDETGAHDYIKYSLDSQRVLPRTNFELALTQKSSSRVVGSLNLRIESPKNLTAEIGYTLAKEIWGQGIATEAASELLRFGFTDLKLHRILAIASPANHASHRVLEKIGMRKEGVHLKNVRQRGGWRDSVVYAILEEEWTRRH